MFLQIKREVATMKLIKHPNVVQLYEVMGSRTKIYIVLEFVTGGELFDKIVSIFTYASIIVIGIIIIVNLRGKNVVYALMDFLM